MNVNVGDDFPDFSLESPQGTVSRADLAGRRAVVYFYPKDATPGCTRQAIDAQRLFDDFVEMDVSLVGISVDSVDSHAGFAAQCSLGFPLLSDPDQELSGRLGILRTHWKYPEIGEFAGRVTFLLDPSGRIEAIWPAPDDAHGHMDLVADEVRSRLGAR